MFYLCYEVYIVIFKVIPAGNIVFRKPHIS